jgi:hypothetical protein
MTLARRLLGSASGAGSLAPDYAAIIRNIYSSVPAAGTNYGYHTLDSAAHDMGFFKCIDDGVGGYVACYAWSTIGGDWEVDVATSDDLLTWTYAATIELEAHSGTIGRRPTGEFVVAYEKDLQSYGAGGNYMVVRVYDTLTDLLAADYSTSYNVPRTLATADNAEGTPHFYSTAEPLDIGFHYNVGAGDQVARGTLTTLSSWSAADDGDLNDALDGLGYASHGRMDSVTLHGTELVFVEAGTHPVDWGEWDIVVWDGATAEVLTVTTHGGSTSQAVPSLSIVGNPSGSGSVLLCHVWFFADGGAVGEPGCALYYRGV